MARTLAGSLYHELPEKGRRKLLLDIARSDHDLVRAMLEYEPHALADALDALAEEEIEGWETGNHNLPPAKLIQELCDILEGRKTPEEVSQNCTTRSPRMRP